MGAGCNCNSARKLWTTVSLIYGVALGWWLKHGRKRQGPQPHPYQTALFIQSGLRLSARALHAWGLGVGVKFWIFWPPPLLVCIQQLIYTIRFTQPPLLRLIFSEPPSSADVINGSPLTTVNILFYTRATKTRARRMWASYTHFRISTLQIFC